MHVFCQINFGLFINRAIKIFETVFFSFRIPMYLFPWYNIVDKQQNQSILILARFVALIYFIKTQFQGVGCCVKCK